MKIRSFVAIPLEDNIKEKILKDLVFNNEFKITKKENLHITLLFLGDVEGDNIPKIIEKLNKVIQNKKVFKINITNFGQFPPKGVPRIIFATGNEGKEELKNMAKEVRRSIKELGFEDNKNFKFHITVARAKKWADKEIKLPEIDKELEIQVDKIVLYRSDLTPEGPNYTSLWEGYLN